MHLPSLAQHSALPSAISDVRRNEWLLHTGVLIFCIKEVEEVTLKLYLQTVAKLCDYNIVSLQDIDGNTALHVAVLQHRNEGVSILLDAGADPTLYNSMCFSPILEAAKNGFYA